MPKRIKKSTIKRKSVATKQKRTKTKAKPRRVKRISLKDYPIVPYVAPKMPKPPTSNRDDYQPPPLWTPRTIVPVRSPMAAAAMSAATGNVGGAVASGVFAALDGITSSVRNATDKAWDIGKAAWDVATPTIGYFVELFGKLGLNSLLRLNDDFKNRSGSLNPDNAKRVIRIMKSKLLKRNPSYARHPIMDEFRQLNRMLYIIEGMSAEGMTNEELQMVKSDLKAYFAHALEQFNSLMQ